MEFLAAPPEAAPEAAWAAVEDAAAALPSTSHIAPPEDFEQREARALEALLAAAPLPQLFALLHLASREAAPARVNLVSGVLVRLFGSATLGPQLLVVDGLPKAFAAGLGHGAAAVRRTTTSVLLRLLGGPRAAEVAALTAGPELLPALTARLLDEEVGIASEAADAILKAAAVLPAEKLAPIFTALYEVRADDATMDIRVAEAAARAAALSDGHFAAAQAAHALERLFGLLSSGDILLRLNALEALEHLVGCRAAVHYLFSAGHVSALLEDAKGDDMIAGPAALRIVAAILAEAGKPDGDGYFDNMADGGLVTDFLGAAVATMDTRDEAAKLAAMWAVSGFAAASPAALAAVRGDAALLSAWLDTRGLNVGLKGACLQSLARAVRPNHIPYAEAAALLGAFSAQHDGDATVGGALDFLLATLRSPVAELRHGAFAVLAAVAARGAAGARAVYQCPGVRALLLDRATEASKEGLEWKFSVIEALRNNGDRGAALSPQENDEIVLEAKRGPFYRPAAVAEMETL